MVTILLEPLVDIGTINIAGLPLFGWLGVLTLLMLFVTGGYGAALMKAWIKGSINVHRYMAYATMALGILHGIFSVALYL